MTAEWAGRQMVQAGLAGIAALRKLLGRRWRHSGPRRFNCRAEEVIDETCPQFEDRFLCVWMRGCIPVPENNFDTDVRLELLDVTDGATHPEPVLSVSSQWRRAESPVFYYQTRNGVIPSSDAVLAAEIAVAKIPFHLLRFARRGRRRLQVTVTVVACSDGSRLAQAHDYIEHVFCSEGFAELQERRENVIRACVDLACSVAAQNLPLPPGTVDRIDAWVSEKIRRFVPRSDVTEPLSRLQGGDVHFDVHAACECLLAWGQKADRTAAMDLAVQTIALFPAMTSCQEKALWEMAETLHIGPDRFMAICQKRLLTDNCSYDRWRLLLGVRDVMQPEDLRCRLNEEYRKWNARVTHADPQIRRQADIILSLIAEVRNRQQKAVLIA